jgi:hypothetical protein
MTRAFVFLTTSATFMLMNFSFTIIDANSDSSFVNQQYLDQTNDWEFIGTPTGNFSISTWKVSQLLCYSKCPTYKYTSSKITWNYRILKHLINGISFPYLSSSATIVSSPSIITVLQSMFWPLLYLQWIAQAS